MTVYGFRCRTCDTRANSHDRLATLGPCPNPGCDGELKRCYRSVQLAPVMQEHYNPSVNAMVSSERQIVESFKRASDEYSARTGIEANFQPLDPKDAKMTGDGLEATNRRRVAEGQRPIPDRLVTG